MNELDRPLEAVKRVIAFYWERTRLKVERTQPSLTPERVESIDGQIKNTNTRICSALSGIRHCLEVSSLDSIREKIDKVAEMDGQCQALNRSLCLQLDGDETPEEIDELDRTERPLMEQHRRELAISFGLDPEINLEDFHSTISALEEELCEEILQLGLIQLMPSEPILRSVIRESAETN
jgi:hypothetical protein